MKLGALEAAEQKWSVPSEMKQERSMSRYL